MWRLNCHTSLLYYSQSLTCNRNSNTSTGPCIVQTLVYPLWSHCMQQQFRVHLERQAIPFWIHYCHQLVGRIASLMRPDFEGYVKHTMTLRNFSFMQNTFGFCLKITFNWSSRAPHFRRSCFGLLHSALICSYNDRALSRDIVFFKLFFWSSGYRWNVFVGVNKM